MPRLVGYWWKVEGHPSYRVVKAPLKEKILKAQGTLLSKLHVSDRDRTWSHAERPARPLVSRLGRVQRILSGLILAVLSVNSVVLHGGNYEH